MTYQTAAAVALRYMEIAFAERGDRFCDAAWLESYRSDPLAASDVQPIKALAQLAAGGTAYAGGGLDVVAEETAHEWQEAWMLRHAAFRFNPAIVRVVIVRTEGPQKGETWEQDRASSGYPQTSTFKPTGEVVGRAQYGSDDWLTVVRDGATFYLVNAEGVAVDEWLPLDPADWRGYLLENGYQVGEATSERLTLQPSWSQAAAIVALALEQGTDTGRDMARKELAAMARLLDALQGEALPAETRQRLLNVYLAGWGDAKPATLAEA